MVNEQPKADLFLNPVVVVPVDEEERYEPSERKEEKVEKKTKKKRLPAWCWYCDREFKDLQVLNHHQRSRHFKCPYCAKRLHSASGLLVHAAQIHKDKPALDRVPNAIEGHDGGEWEIYGMRGVPEEDLERWRKGFPMIKREGRRGMTGVGLVSILAAQKQAQGPEPAYALPSRPSLIYSSNAPPSVLEEGQISFTENGNYFKEQEFSESNQDQITVVPSTTTNSPITISNTAPKIVASGKVVKRQKNIFD